MRSAPHNTKESPHQTKGSGRALTDTILFGSNDMDFEAIPICQILCLTDFLIACFELICALYLSMAPYRGPIAYRLHNMLSPNWQKFPWDYAYDYASLVVESVVAKPLFISLSLCFYLLLAYTCDQSISPSQHDANIVALQFRTVLR